MHFDDRLGTVLRLSADGAGLRRIQYRQLIDLLGTCPADSRGELIDAAFVRLGELASAIPAASRAAIVAQPGLRLRSPRLVAALAAEEPAVAEAAILRAELTEEEWLDLLPALAPPARRHLLARPGLAEQLAERLDRLGVHGRALPAGQTADPDQAEPGPRAPAAGGARPAGAAPPPPEPAAPLAEGEGIGAIVRRIEAFRKQREALDSPLPGDSPRLPLGEDHVLRAPGRVQAFDFATDAAGQVVWSDPGVAAMAIGMHLAARGGPGAVSGSDGLGEALRRRQPINAQQVVITGAPAIAGAWQIDAAVWFDPLSGRHMGWRGRMRRPGETAPAAPPNPPVRDSEADRIRQMLHELRTPVNAIQGFAEVIQQQLFGPTPHEYRALASGIVGDAARMLSAFEELERLARLDSDALSLEPGESDAAQVIEATIAQLGAHTRPRGSGFALKVETAPLPVGLAPAELERTAWRLLATLAGTSAPGEILKTRLRARSGEVRLDIALPAVLAAREGDALFSANAGAVPQGIAAGVFGVGFALRLARAEARAAGGDLTRKGDRLRLALPGLTRLDAEPNHELPARS